MMPLQPFHHALRPPPPLAPVPASTSAAATSCSAPEGAASRPATTASRAPSPSSRPAGAGLCTHLPVTATADEHKVYKFMCILVPERPDPNSANSDDTTRWAKADAFVPAHKLIGGGKPTFINVTVGRADAPGRSASYTPIEDFLLDLSRGKRDHYVDELAPGGPLHHGPTSSLSSSRRVGASASRPMRCSSPGRTMATFILRQYREVVGVALQRAGERADGSEGGAPGQYYRD